MATFTVEQFLNVRYELYWTAHVVERNAMTFSAHSYVTGSRNSFGQKEPWRGCVNYLPLSKGSWYWLNSTLRFRRRLMSSCFRSLGYRLHVWSPRSGGDPISDVRMNLQYTQPERPPNSPLLGWHVWIQVQKCCQIEFEQISIEGKLVNKTIG